MIDISGHLRSYRQDTGFEDMTKPLIINCCGYQAFTTLDFARSRPLGRADYQIIYIYNGEGRFCFGDKWHTLTKGNLILYRPYEAQLYEYTFKNYTEVFWIHFTGSECEKLLQSFAIATGYIGESLQLKSLFQEIILELQLKKVCYEEILESNFIKLLAFIKRSTHTATTTTENNVTIDRLIIHLNQHYMKPWSIQRMADFCGLSIDYFSHLFKLVVGVPPLQFLTNLRMEKAKDLLIAKGMSVSSVAYLIGYNDPLYFSRVFKKQMGVSPATYQRTIMALETPFSTK